MQPKLLLALLLMFTASAISAPDLRLLSTLDEMGSNDKTAVAFGDVASIRRLPKGIASITWKEISSGALAAAVRSADDVLRKSARDKVHKGDIPPAYRLTANIAEPPVPEAQAEKVTLEELVAGQPDFSDLPWEWAEFDCDARRAQTLSKSQAAKSQQADSWNPVVVGSTLDRLMRLACLRRLDSPSSTDAPVEQGGKTDAKKQSNKGVQRKLIYKPDRIEIPREQLRERGAPVKAHIAIHIRVAPWGLVESAWIDESEPAGLLDSGALHTIARYRFEVGDAPFETSQEFDLNFDR